MRLQLKHRYLLFLVLCLKVELLRGEAPGFSASTRVICRVQLQKMGPSDSKRFYAEFDQLKKLDPDSSGKMKPSLGEALGIGKAPNNKSYFLNKLWWSESAAKVSPTLHKVSEAEAARVKQGIEVPQHRGELIFVGEKTQARMTVTVTERQKALTLEQQKNNPHIKNNANFEIIINDAGRNITESSFKEWTDSIMKESQMEGIVKAENEAKGDTAVPKYSVRSVAREDGSIDYVFNIKNMRLPFFRLNYLVENTQRSLAETDYRSTREQMAKDLGVPAHPASDFSQSPYTNGKNPNLDSDEFWNVIVGGYEVNSGKEKYPKEKDKKNKPQRGDKSRAYYD